MTLPCLTCCSNNPHSLGPAIKTCFFAPRQMHSYFKKETKEVTPLWAVLRNLKCQPHGKDGCWVAVAVWRATTLLELKPYNYWLWAHKEQDVYETKQQKLDKLYAAIEQVWDQLLQQSIWQWDGDCSTVATVSICTISCNVNNILTTNPLHTIQSPRLLYCPLSGSLNLPFCPSGPLQYLPFTHFIHKIFLRSTESPMLTWQPSSLIPNLQFYSKDLFMTPDHFFDVVGVA